MKKKLFVSMIAIIAVLMILPLVVNAIGNYGVNFSSAAYTSANPFAQAGYTGECTWYCWGRAYEKCGISLPCRGNANTWQNTSGYPTDQTPSANSIAVWTSGSYGHVAFVENYSNGIIYLSESNLFYNGVPSHVYSEGNINLSTGYYTNTFTDYSWGLGNWSGRGTPNYYIHLSSTTPTAETHTVYFDANGGSVSTGSKTVTNGSIYGDLPTPTRNYYDFTGWFTSDTGGMQVTSSTTCNISSDQTLHAHWTRRISSQGQCGDNATYILYADGELIVSGSGDIRGSVFEGMPITKATITDGITSIGESAFYRCFSLNSIMMTDSVTKIGSWAFGSCYYLTDLTLSDNITSIGSYAFYSCESLTSITLPRNIKKLKEGTFQGCRNLSELVIPDSVMGVDRGVFGDCNNLTSVYIGSGVFAIYDTFGSCSKLQSIDVSPQNTHYSSKDGVLYDKKKTKLLVCPQGKTGNFIIPDTVESIGEKDTVDNIGTQAFYNCNNLTTIEIPDSVTSIGDNAFFGCSNLTAIEIPNSVTYIGRWAFGYCSNLATVKIPGSVASIGDRAFEYCTSLTVAEILNGVTNIGDGIFEYCTSLTTVKIPNTVTNIGNYEFSGCSNLATLEIPNTVISIGYYAFFGCGNLTTIEIPDSVTSIGDYAFSDCRRLTTITLPYNITKIGSYILYRTAYATDEANWTDGILYINNYLIDVKEGVTTCTIRDGTTIIADFAFGSCQDMDYIIIPKSVISVGDEVLGKAIGFSFAYYKGSKKDWEKVYVGDYNDNLIRWLICESKDCAVIIPGFTEPIVMQNDTCDGTIIIALYDNFKKLVDLKTYVPTESITAVLPDNISYKTAKIMWWESLSSLKPLCDSYTINK